MPAVQKQFEDFHTAIKLDNDDEKAKLREKRKVLGGVPPSGVRT